MKKFIFSLGGDSKMSFHKDSITFSRGNPFGDGIPLWALIKAMREQSDRP